MTKTYNIVGKRKIYYIVSSSIIILAILVGIIFGVDMSIDFKGGTMLSYAYEGDINLSDVKKVAGDKIKQNFTVTNGENFSDSSKYFQISLSSKEGISSDEQNDLSNYLSEKFSDYKVKTLSATNVKPSMGKVFFAKCLVAIIVASLILIIYIALRFRKISGLSAGVTGIIALIHDLCIVYATFVFFRIPIDVNFMAVCLTILGYSINDTIVIYDRVRENKKLLGNKISTEELVNMSINQSLSRSVNTTFSTILVLASICVVALITGVTSILSFSFPLIIGMISGVYSTICIAGPLWVDWMNFKKKRTDKHGRKSSKA